jgi:transposase
LANVMTTDAQRAVLDPLLPDPAWLAGRGGRPEAHCRRQVVDAIFYLVDNASNGALPTDFPPWPTVYKHLAAWEAAAPKGSLPGTTGGATSGFPTVSWESARTASSIPAVPAPASGFM